MAPFPITVEGVTLDFQPVPLVFLDKNLVNIFAQKNNKTVRETLLHKRYSKFDRKITENFLAELDMPLGSFLFKLKLAGNPIYKSFLNPYGDGQYCRFRIERSQLSISKGLYCFRMDGQIVYVGRSFDPFEKRINQGYGTIHPKNCYLDGQATNCHLNGLIAENTAVVSFYVSPINDDDEIERLERLLIKTLKPKWNIALNR